MIIAKWYLRNSRSKLFITTYIYMECYGCKISAQYEQARIMSWLAIACADYFNIISSIIGMPKHQA